MSDSILTTIKKLLGNTADDDSFDTDIILAINSAFHVLRQLGVGPDEGFSISGASSKWDDFLDDYSQLELIKSYIYCKVRKIFDPPQSSSAMQALDDCIAEFEWRINVTVDPGGY